MICDLSQNELEKFSRHVPCHGKNYIQILAILLYNYLHEIKVYILMHRVMSYFPTIIENSSLILENKNKNFFQAVFF